MSAAALKRAAGVSRLLQRGAARAYSPSLAAVPACSLFSGSGFAFAGQRSVSAVASAFAARISAPFGPWPRRNLSSEATASASVEAPKAGAETTSQV